MIGCKCGELLCAQEGVLDEVDVLSTKQTSSMVGVSTHVVLDMVGEWAFPITRILTAHILLFMEGRILDEVARSPSPKKIKR